MTTFFSSSSCQTFIRGAAGKALVDSPALNPHSRQVLVPIQREIPILGPMAISGPGPIEPGTAPVPSLSTSKPAPPLPHDNAGAGGSLEGEASAGEEDEEDAGFSTGKPTVSRQDSTDPYANLGAAFNDTELLF